MKGMVFTTFQSMVEELHGIEMWDRVLERARPESEGIYTAGASYCDAELFRLVEAMHELTGVPVKSLVRAFGRYAFGEFARHYPVFFEGLDAKQLLRSVDEVIHVEVKKLYPDALLPTFDFEDPGEQELVMIYRSRRKLCDFAEGLIEGAAHHYNVNIHSDHNRCMHQGDDHCRIELVFSGRV